MTENYEVGYRKPPKASQWKAGQSGNPLGKKKMIKAAPPLANLFANELSEMVEVKIAGKSKKVSKAQALATTVINHLIKAEPRDQPKLLQMLDKLGVFAAQSEKYHDAESEEVGEFTPAERRMIEAAKGIMEGNYDCDEDEQADGGQTDEEKADEDGQEYDELDLAKGMISLDE